MSWEYNQLKESNIETITYIPGALASGGSVGASIGAILMVQFTSYVLAGSGEGVGVEDNWSLSHNSEQLVFQKPIFLCSRSYVTSVFRTIIAVTKRDNQTI